MSAAPKTPQSRTAIQKKGTKSIACQRCHSRKVKCSGGHPCTNCRDADKVADCVYPSRDRQVNVSQQYLEEILKENERLRDKSVNPAAPPDSSIAARAGDTIRTVPQDTVQNPLLEDRPWFFPLASLDMPIHISEAANAAFATRFRQTLATVCTNHIPRTSYISDEQIVRLSDSECPWPSPARARFLVKAALNTVCRYYHMVRGSVVEDTLESAIRNHGNSDRLSRCKLLALFALGEVYSTKIGAEEASFPGIAYFARARRMVSVPAERPRLDTLEIVFCLIIYSYALNKRHTAYAFATSSVRLGTIMGMHLNIPDHQMRDREAREHRTRLWWSAYILDRTCASTLGHPPTIYDEDIQVDLPSSEGLSEASKSDFGDAEYFLRSIELARLSTQVVSSIYSRRKHQIPFSQRVQSSLRDLTKWSESLPDHLQLHAVGAAQVSPNHIIFLHLTFNQCVILATRPILLHVLRCHKDSWSDSSKDLRASLPDRALALAETCIQCSRHSYRLLAEAWINGSFSIFDYFNTQYLFSSALNLAISSLLGSAQSRSDGDCFNNAAELLQQLAQNGNFGAIDFCQHLDAMKQSMAGISKGGEEGPGPGVPLGPSLRAAQAPTFPVTGSAMTAGMALAEPSLQEFLAEPDLNLQLFDTPVFYNMQTPYWTELWGDGWTAG